MWRTLTACSAGGLLTVGDVVVESPDLTDGDGRKAAAVSPSVFVRGRGRRG